MAGRTPTLEREHGAGLAADDYFDHVVAAMLDDGTTIRLPRYYSWGGAQARWDALDDARRAGLLPGVRYLVVRSANDPDPRWVGARRATCHDLRAIDPRHPKGFASLEAAGRAWGRHAGYSGGTGWGPSGSGGWIFLDGRPQCHGWFRLACWARDHGHVRLVNDRWMVMQ